jgi:hypothetical protein
MLSRTEQLGPHVVTYRTARDRRWARGSQGSASPWDRLWASYPLVDQHYPKAECVRVVLDNLSTHTPAALYETFEPIEARRILNRLEFHYTPKHASWLNMVEIEIGVMVAQCLDRRIPEKALLVSEVAAWQRRRNREKARIKWLFTVTRAREKLGRAYPVIAGRVSARVAA